MGSRSIMDCSLREIHVLWSAIVFKKEVVLPWDAKVTQVVKAYANLKWLYSFQPCITQLVFLLVIPFRTAHDKCSILSVSASWGVVRCQLMHVSLRCGVTATSPLTLSAILTKGTFIVYMILIHSDNVQCIIIRLSWYARRDWYFSYFSLISYFLPLENTEMFWLKTVDTYYW